ncbi:MAG TPA: GNAT family N-acetyltransferase [Blastocatellia bacterium]|nr:GNAT family N-acetyltransferase [Blastocatellia bacterium]
MQSLFAKPNMVAGLQPGLATANALSVRALSASDEAEVWDFLSARPIHTVFMKGFIKQNGLVSDFNRGKFYGCRDMEGRLLGVALLGHITLIETRIDAALRAFANYARGGPSIYMILGEQEKVECFWDSYSAGAVEPRQQRRELLFVQEYPPPIFEPLPELRVATPDDLRILLPIYGQMHSQESGVNPLEVDPQGFSERWLRRIEQKQAWVWIKGEKLIFNADIMCDTPDCTYLEGIYVAPNMRGKGYGLRCMSHLSHMLLARARSLCLLCDDQNSAATNFFQKAGYDTAGYYKTIFLSWKS